MANDRTESIIPEHIWKLTQHYHDMFELKKHWEMLGIVAPKAFEKELQRSHDRLIELLDEEWNQGGAYHTHHQMKLMEKANETRQRPQHRRSTQDRTQVNEGHSGSGGEHRSNDPLPEAATTVRPGVLGPKT